MTFASRISLQEALDRKPLSAAQVATVLLCWICAMLDGFDVQAISFAAPGIMRTWGVASDKFGLVMAAGLAGVMVGSIIQGPLSDGAGRRPVILMSLLGVMVGSAACIFVMNLAQLAALRFLIGVPLGMLLPNLLALVSESAPTSRKLFFVALTTSGFPLGAFLGGMASAAIVPLFDWRAVFVFGAILPAAMFLPMWLFVPESATFLLNKRRQTDSPSGRARLERRIQSGLRRLAVDPDAISLAEATETLPSERPRARFRSLFAPGTAKGTLLLWVIFASNGLALYSIISWLPVILTTAGAEGKDALIPLSLLNLGGVFGGALVAWLGDRVGGARVLAIAYGLGIGACLLNSWAITHSAAAFSFSAVLVGLTLGGGQMTASGLAAKWYPTHLRSTGLGGVAVAGRAASVLATIVGGVLLQIEPSGTAFFLICAIASGIAAAAASWFAPGTVINARTDKSRRSRAVETVEPV